MNMFLQYEGLSGVDCYEEADGIACANVYVSDLTNVNLVSSPGRTVCGTEREIELKVLDAIYRAVTDRLIQRFNVLEKDIEFRISGALTDVAELAVAFLDTRSGKRCVYAFGNVNAYLLNDHGKTIRRLCRKDT